MVEQGGVERHDVVVVGGGQAGLAASHHLARAGIEHVVLDAGRSTGDAWRGRWDSLRLFTPAAIDGLPGMPFPGAPSGLPTKDEMADYLVAYAEREHAPVRHGIRVDLLDRDADGFVLVAGDHRYHARDVIVATGYLNSPVVPPFASMLDPRIAQLHSIEYRNPSSVPEGPVLIVGGGNSGVEIGLELATTGHEVLLAGHSTFMPTFAQVGGGRVFFGVARRLFTLGTPVGRRMAAATRHHGAPVIRVRPRQLAAAGVERVARVATVTDGRPVLEDGRRPDVASVVWCTGFRPDFSWIRVPVIGEDGYPRQRYGLVPDQPGIAFLGLHFQSSFLSALVGGVGDDAAGIVAGIVRRRSAPTASAAAQPA